MLRADDHDTSGVEGACGSSSFSPPRLPPSSPDNLGRGYGHESHHFPWAELSPLPRRHLGERDFGSPGAAAFTQTPLPAIISSHMRGLEHTLADGAFSSAAVDIDSYLGSDVSHLSQMTTPSQLGLASVRILKQGVAHSLRMAETASMSAGGGQSLPPYHSATGAAAHAPARTTIFHVAGGGTVTRQISTDSIKAPAGPRQVTQLNGESHGIGTVSAVLLPLSMADSVDASAGYAQPLPIAPDLFAGSAMLDIDQPSLSSATPFSGASKVSSSSSSHKKANKAHKRNREADFGTPSNTRRVSVDIGSAGGGRIPDASLSASSLLTPPARGSQAVSVVSSAGSGRSAASRDTLESSSAGDLVTPRNRPAAVDEVPPAPPRPTGALCASVKRVKRQGLSASSSRADCGSELIIVTISPQRIDIDDQDAASKRGAPAAAADTAEGARRQSKRIARASLLASSSSGGAADKAGELGSLQRPSSENMSLTAELSGGIFRLSSAPSMAHAFPRLAATPPSAMSATGASPSVRDSNLATAVSVSASVTAPSASNRPSFARTLTFDVSPDRVHASESDGASAATGQVGSTCGIPRSTRRAQPATVRPASDVDSVGEASGTEDADCEESDGAEVSSFWPAAPLNRAAPAVAAAGFSAATHSGAAATSISDALSDLSGSQTSSQVKASLRAASAASELSPLHATVNLRGHVPLALSDATAATVGGSSLRGAPWLPPFAVPAAADSTTAEHQVSASIDSACALEAPASSGDGASVPTGGVRSSGRKRKLNSMFADNEDGGNVLLPINVASQGNPVTASASAHSGPAAVAAAHLNVQVLAERKLGNRTVRIVARS